MAPLPLLEADSLEITILVDNQIDALLDGDEEVHRRPWAAGMAYNPLLEEPNVRITLQAEHGFASMVTVRRPGETHRMLFDAGLSPEGLIHNMDRLEIDAKEVEAVALSHGHWDHTGGLAGLVERLGKANMPLLAHPRIYTQRRAAPPGREPTPLVPPSRSALEGAGFELIEERDPSLILAGALLLTGEVPRVTDFEQGFPFFQSDEGNGWAPEPHLLDDQALIANVKDKGLVVLTGCGHAGIVNIVRRAVAVTGITRVHGILGGFHLSGAYFEPVIGRTIDGLRGFQPQLIVPAHCTGWKPQQMIAAAFPEAYVHNAVGTTYVV
jgi:7,8-dihydropterin-6-yl-methyl-4-(beta-D-ribofuranosyl)aminobenzene 5'-phosphate synthase